MNILKSCVSGIGSKGSFKIHQEHTTLYSEHAMTLACRFSLIEASLSSANKPHTFCQLLKNFLETIQSEDPDKFHYDIARTTLSLIDQETLKNEHVVDMLARELVKACRLFDKRFKLPASFARLLKCDQKMPNDPYLIIVELPKAADTFEEQFFTDNGCALWDSEYLKLLESTGTTGKRQSKVLAKKFTSRKRTWDARFWFKEHALESGAPFFHSPAFLSLAAVLWQDKVSPQISTPSLNLALSAL